MEQGEENKEKGTGEEKRGRKPRKEQGEENGRGEEKKTAKERRTGRRKRGRRKEKKKTPRKGEQGGENEEKGNKTERQAMSFPSVEFDESIPDLLIFFSVLFFFLFLGL